MKYILKKIISVFKNEKKPFKFLFALFLYLTNLCKLLKIKIKREFYNIYFNKTSYSVFLWTYNQQQIDDEFFLSKILKDGDIFVDVGANIGTLTLTALKFIGEKGFSHSIEPHPKTFKYLESNIKLNKYTNYKTYNIGLGDKISELGFSNLQSDDMNSIQENGEIKIKVDTLDNLNINKIDLLKIDVEGYEKFVFLGAKETLKNTKFIYFESFKDNYNKYNYSLFDIFNILKTHNFNIYILGNNLQLKKIDEYHESYPEYENLLAIREENLNEFYNRINI